MQNANSSLFEVIDIELEAPASQSRANEGAEAPAQPLRNAHGSGRPHTRAESNRLNAEKSTGPRTEAGKQKAAANSLKHGFFANLDDLNPADSPAYQTTLNNLRAGLRPADPAEEQSVRELAMLSARLQRLAAIDHVLMSSEIDTPTAGTDADEFELTAAFLNNETQLTRLSRAEAHLQRAYNRTWDRLLRLQKDRKKLERASESVLRGQEMQTKLTERTQQAASHSQPKAATANSHRESATQTAAPLRQSTNQRADLQKLELSEPKTAALDRRAA